MNMLDYVRRLYSMMSSCRLCPRECGINRLKGNRGSCGAGLLPEIASATAHFGEEPPLSGWQGSGTFFFSHCSLHCLFCQNWPISQRKVGRALTIDQLAEKMLQLQERGVHNINLVNPTHYWPQIAASVYLARKKGMTLPVMANSSGFENIQTLMLLTDVVQIWLPDIKYASAGLAEEMSGQRKICKAAWKAVGWMIDQTGPLKIGQDGIAESGVLIRHLVLPGKLENTRLVLRGIRQRFANEIPVSLMTQYFPANEAHKHPTLNRPLTKLERQRAQRMITRLGLSAGWRQSDG